MRAGRALRLAGCGGGVEDGGIILRIERHVRQRPIRQEMPVADLAKDAFELAHLRMRDLLALAADEDALQRRTILQVFEYSFEPLAIDDGDLGAGIIEA